jgi:hypothetical protein
VEILNHREMVRSTTARSMSRADESRRNGRRHDARWSAAVAGQQSGDGSEDVGQGCSLRDEFEDGRLLRKEFLGLSPRSDIEHRPGVSEHLAGLGIANTRPEFKPAETSISRPVAAFVMTVGSAARHDGGEQLDRSLSFVWMHVLHEIPSHAVLHGKASHPGPRLIEVGPVTRWICLKHDFVQAVQEVGRMEWKVGVHDEERARLRAIGGKY